MTAVKKPWSDRAGMGCAILFLLPFAATGIACAVMAAWHVWLCWDAQSWTERPCTIVRAELKTHHDEGKSYRVEAEYRYEFNDQPFTGSRVWFGTGSDNISRFHQNAHRELEQCQEQGRPFRCFVDPNDPSSSVLYRDLRYEMVGFLLVFVLTFGGIGVGGLAGLVYVSRQTRRMNDARELRPSEPWTWSDANQDGSYRPLASWVGIVLFALFWNSISWTVTLTVLIEEWKKGLSWMWFFMLFPVIGVGAAGMAVKAVWHRMRFGLPMLTVRPWPLFVGDPIEGTIDFPAGRPASPDLNVELSVLRKSTTEDSPDTKLFHETTSISNVDSGAAFRLSSPSGLPRTALLNDETGTPTAKWQIKVTGSNGSADFEAIYELTVFQREARQNQGPQNDEHVG